MNVAAGQCFSLALLLTSFVLRDIALPPSLGGNVVIGNLSHIVCDEIDIGTASVVYNDTAIAVRGLQTTRLLCHADFNATDDPSVLTIDVELPPMDVAVAMSRDSDSCHVAAAAMTACDVAPRLVNLTLTPPGPNWLLNGLLASVESLVNSELPAAICAIVNGSLVPALLNDTVPPAEVAPLITPGLTDLVDSKIVTTILNVVRGLPTLFGLLQLTAYVATPTSMQIDVNIVQPLDIDLPLGAGFLKVLVPGNATLSLQLWFKDFVCSSPFTCVLAKEGGLTLHNVRLTGVGELDRVVDGVVGPLLETLLNPILAAVVSLLGPQQSSDGYEYSTISLGEAETVLQPPFALAVGLASLFSGCAIAVIGYSAYRHAKHPMMGSNGKPVAVRYVLAEDAFIAVTCFFTMFLFAWANCCAGASVVLGESFTMYSFSLSTSIQDLYQAGLVALAFFVALFCGFFTYFKLLAIVVFSVILQRPRSKVLLFIDSCGKLSLLDTFMMMILVTGLEVPGLATVHMLTGFYLFLVATFLSILVGNYACHGWRRNLIEEEDEKQLTTINAADAVAEDSTEVLPLGQEKSSWKRWCVMVALPTAALVMIGSVFALDKTIITYKLSGVATIITGNEKPFSLLQLLQATPWSVYGSGLFTIIIAPMIFSIGYPKSHLLGAWCATDAFLLACVGALLQLTQFVNFVMGPALSTLYQAKAELHTPLLLLLFSMLAQWLLVGASIFHLDLPSLLVRGVNRAWERIRNTRDAVHPSESSYSLSPNAMGTSPTIDDTSEYKFVA
ncbi:paraquat-inducible integral membrane protein, putative [Bodo saltans]|uniref:Paraquat-inducible integral membrane protein, putative n=1 Tax=Bodo saltans TaxID=75058 RepID=A0A0S4JN79_BODSA|nr:paraquat-inducible integral membrane protein, putative [Bodo saltans]|eukprot:CUG90855.1 paraquat-inducible integral membrane protein, putative [Bodo saltans]